MTLVGRIARGRRPPRYRRAVVLLVVIVCLGVAAVMFVSVLKLVAVQKRLLEAEWQRAQAGRLAESAIQRAAARLAADPAYAGETWRLSAEELAQPDNGVATIRVESIVGQADHRRVRVEADYPDHPQLRARQEREAILPVPKGTKP
jgi:Tfp pilus assembly protein PilX